MNLNPKSLIPAALLCLSFALAGCSGHPASPAPTAAASSEPSTPAPEPSDAQTPASQTRFDFGEGARVTFPENMVFNSIEDERIDFTSATPAAMDTYWLKDSSSTQRVALVRVHSDARLYDDPNAPATRDAVLECLKNSVFPTLTSVLSDTPFLPPLAEAEFTPGTYKTDAGDLPMLEIQTQDAYRLRAVIAPHELIVLLGFSEAEKQPIMDYLDSLTIAKPTD